MRRFMPSHSALLAFEAAARHLSFTKAARALSITQSGVSRQISTLEALLGARLFERVGSRLVLTEAAQVYLGEISAALDQIERASVNCVRGQTLDAALRVCVHPTLASRWLTPRLSRYMAAHPDVLIDLAVTTREMDVWDSDADLAILRGRGSWRGARADELFGEDLVVVASPELAAAHDFDGVLDFDRLPSLQNASRPDLWLTWLQISGRAYCGAIRGPRFPQSGMLITAAVTGLGLAVVPALYVADELARGDLVLPLGGPVTNADSYWLVHAEGRAEPAMLSGFRSWILDEARAYRRGGG